MAIEGPLRELGLTDVLQLVHLSRKTGVLTVTDRTGVSGQVYVDKGAIVGARAAGEASRLGELLVLAGKATQGQIDRALREQHIHPETRLGEILVDRIGIARADVEQQLRFEIEEVVFDLIRWEEGSFSFAEITPPHAGSVSVRLSTEGLLIEAMRRTDEWTLLAAGAPDNDLVPGLVEVQGYDTGILSIQPLEWEVLAAIDGDRPLRSIARALGRAEFDVAKAIFTLVSTGIVELRQRTGGGIAVEQEPAGGAESDVRADLRAGRLDSAERRLDDLLKKHPSRGDLHALRGELAARRSEWKRAVDSLTTAVRLDPLLARAYYTLGMSALRTGEFVRAGEALDTYLRLAEEAPQRRERAERASRLAAELEMILEEDRK